MTIITGEIYLKHVKTVIVTPAFGPRASAYDPKYYFYFPSNGVGITDQFQFTSESKNR